MQFQNILNSKNFPNENRKTTLEVISTIDDYRIGLFSLECKVSNEDTHKTKNFDR